MGTYIDEGMSGKTFAVMMIVGALLIGGAVHSSYLASQKEAQKQEEQGCAYYARHTIEQVPVACYEFFKRNNHWNPDKQ